MEAHLSTLTDQRTLEPRRLKLGALPCSRLACLLVSALMILAAGNAAAETKAMGFDDLMKLRQIEEPVISSDGRWVAYALVPDRSDGELVVRAVGGEILYRVDRGRRPAISADGLWLAAAIEPTLEEQEKSRETDQKSKADEPASGMALVDLRDGTTSSFERVKEYAFSEDGRWLAILHLPDPEESPTGEEPAEPLQTPGDPDAGEGARQPRDSEDQDGADEVDEHLGSRLRLISLSDGLEIVVEWVKVMRFDETGSFLAYATSAPGGSSNGVLVRRLRMSGAPEIMLRQAANLSVEQLHWARDGGRLGLISTILNDEGEPGEAELWLWQTESGVRRLVSQTDAPEGHRISHSQELVWSRDGARLFFGLTPTAPGEDGEAAEPAADEQAEPSFHPYDLDAILEKRGLDVWHWNDPRIIPNQKKRWEKHEKERSYRAVVHIDEQRIVQLADADLPDVETSDNPLVTLGRSDAPYLRELTWDGEYSDLYAVNLLSGGRRLVARRLRSEATLSPDGRYILYYEAGDWFLHDLAESQTRNVTAELEVPFANEDHDYPAEPPGYGHFEWLSDSSAVLIYDKYDIWKIFSGGAEAQSLTGGQGRRRSQIFRAIDLDPEEDTLSPGSTLLLEAYHDLEKHDAFYSARLDRSLPQQLLGTGNHRLELIAKAEEADRILFTRERYDEFPDLWTAGLTLMDARRLSNANPEIAELAWGEAELVEWTSLDGVPLQGVLIKPGSYQPGTRYPVLVYFYRLMSQRLHLFNQPVVNHRPSFPLYASNGYAVFLPDIRFEVGRPGLSATKCLVPGVQKLVEMGVADPDAIGLHGHSWGGYLTAFMVTQTDFFAAAVAGAPVSNMTSAYSGIRRKTGLARQFQYERSQSRIGGSLWERLDLYLANSPVMHADRINTPLLIQFGDADGAVPFEQGIELYLACRRLDKDCIMLQYRGEPHHLKQYANKLDYSIKMKQFFDHHLKGEPAPEWMTDGVPYTGD